MQTKPLLWVAAILFLLGWLPLVHILHLTTQAAEIILAINWISGGLLFVTLAKIKGEW